MLRRAFNLVLVVLLFVPLSRSAGAEGDAITRALAWLHTQQLANGSFGFALPGSASVTADVVYVLALAGQDPDAPAWTVNGQSALAALAALTPSYVAAGGAGPTGKVARAVAAAGRDPRAFAGLDLLALIERAYDPATGRYHPTQLYHHSLALEALRRAGAPIPAAALNALLAAQLPNGGWFWAFIDQAQVDPTSDQSDVDATGRVLQLLAGSFGLGCSPAVPRGVAYLAGGQLATGGWGIRADQTPENANSTALAIAGLRAAGYDPDAAPFLTGGATASAALLSHQEASGAFVYVKPAAGQPDRTESRLMATLDVLTALLQGQAAAVECRAIYLPLIQK